MEFDQWNRIQIEKIRGYIEEQTGLPYEQVDEKERNSLEQEWVAEHAEKFRQELLMSRKNNKEEK